MHLADKQEQIEVVLDINQYSTFFIGDRLFGIDVMKVQEITRKLDMTPVPQAPDYVMGLINLRGQIATAISLRKIFKFDNKDIDTTMNIICNTNDLLFAFVVDRIGDVIEVSRDSFEKTPDTISNSIGKYMTGVYKLDEHILSIIDIENIADAIQKQKV